MTVKELRRHLLNVNQDLPVWFALNDDMIEIQGGIKYNRALLDPNDFTMNEILILCPLSMSEVGGF